MTRPLKLLMMLGILSINLAEATGSYTGFQRFDDQVAVGNSWTFGLVNNGQVYQNNNITLSAGKLFDNGLYVNAGGSQAYSSTYVNYSGNNIGGQIGYAFAVGDKFLVTPGFSLTRGQLSSFDNSSNLNNILYTGIVGANLEYLPFNSLKLSLNGGYGVAGQNGTLNNSNGATVYAGSVSIGGGISYRPLANVPWLLNANYGYNSYGGGLITQTNQVVISTGYAF